MRNISISDSSVRESIKRLNKKKASGPNKMPITFLIHVQTINIITPVISVIFQQSLDRGEISANWKNANIVPIYKNSVIEQLQQIIDQYHSELLYPNY